MSKSRTCNGVLSFFNIRQESFKHLFVSLIALIIFSPSVLAFADDTIQKALIIRVGSYENKPKVYTDENGEIVGLFPDILNYTAKKEGWVLNYVHGTWSECLYRLEKNEIDIMVDVAFSEERAKKYLFANETFLVNWATVYTLKGKAIESLVDLNGKRVAVMKGSIHTEGNGGIKNLAQMFDLDCTFIEVNSYKNVFELLSKNEVDAGVVNRIFGSLFSESYNVGKTSIIFNPRHLRFAFPKESALAPTLIERTDYHLNMLKKDPESIYNKALYVYLSGLPREMIFSDPELEHPDKSIILTTAEKEWIAKHPVILIGVDPEFSPFEFITPEGQYSGIASEYVKILNQRLGLNMKTVKDINWKQAISQAKAKEIDVLPCVGITQNRKKFLKFTKPYINFHRAIITRTDNPFLTGLDDIQGMKVAVQQNSSHEGYLRENTSIEPILCETLQEALLAVSNGQAQALVGNIASATYWIRKLNLTNLKVAAPVSQKTQNLHFAVRDDWIILIGILNKGLASISHTEANNIRQKWINIDYKPGIAPRLVLRYIMQIAGVAFIVLLVIMIWNYKLKNEIKKRIEIDKKLFEANKNLKKLDQLKSMFIASMSHELRTPLNSIIGFTGIILQGMTGPLNEKQSDHLTRVYSSARHLLSLITDVIDISKIEAGRIDVNPEDVLLSDIIDEAIVNIKPQLKAKNLELKKFVAGDIQMYTDRKRLMQCVINYLSNAVKFTENGSITISVKNDAENVELLVKDTGIGIPAKSQKKLFEAFERVDSHLRVKAGGTGLGLYLTRKLVTEILKGEIIMHSQEGRGSTFGFTIPISLKHSNNKNEQIEEEQV